MKHKKITNALVVFILVLISSCTTIGFVSYTAYRHHEIARFYGEPLGY